MTVKMAGHGGELALSVLRRNGVEEMFTLNGAHTWPLYDAAVKVDMPIYDTRHEQTATFAAEGVAKLTRRPGLSVLTAGPGVTNGVSAVTTAHFNGTPLVVLGGRAPAARWGAGSLQEFDHVPVMASITKKTMTAASTESIPLLMAELVIAATSPHRGPVFADFPMDILFAEADVPGDVGAVAAVTVEPDPDDVARAAAMIAGAERPAIVAGGDVWWEGAEGALRAAAERLRVPVFANGLGRGCLAADHELAFSRTRGLLKTEADLVVVVGTPLDFRLSFGRYGDAAVIHVVDHPDGRAAHADVAVSPAGDITAVLTALAEWSGDVADHELWITSLTDREDASRAADADLLAADADPIKPTRVYGEVAARLDRDAVVVCDGGDFVSYAGKYVDSYEGGCWLDTGPYGCLGSGLGHAMAARVVHPDRQVVLMLGDGAAGFSLMDVDSLVRHGLPVVIVVGNNGIWGLEKHPMQAIYGYDVACDLQPATPYDDVAKALGGAGETVATPADIGPALDRALAADVPYVVNVLTDPADVYPRSSNLA